MPHDIFTEPQAAAATSDSESDDARRGRRVFPVRSNPEPRRRLQVQVKTQFSARPAVRPHIMIGLPTSLLLVSTQVFTEFPAWAAARPAAAAVGESFP